MNLNYYRIDNKKIPEIRFLPMSKDVFSTYEKVVEFLSNRMCNEDGEYEYIKCKMRCEENSLVLFQYDAKLIGCAKFLRNIDYDSPIIDSDKNECHGYYVFDIDTVRIFDEPILAEEYKKIDSTFEKFSQGTRETDITLLEQVMKLIISRIDNNYIYNSNMIAEEIIDEENSFSEGAKKKITVNAYERNRQARQKCIDYYKKKNNGILKCEICGFDFSKVYGEQFKHCINIHHTKEISEIGEEYEVNPEKDLLTVCPNCHMILHSKRPGYTPDEVRNIINLGSTEDNMN
ncbi:MAG TPA: hypothetical protein DG753_13705 [Clostridium sp.]|nr:hypothetical protein [Clostridium sp.]